MAHSKQAVAKCVWKLAKQKVPFGKAVAACKKSPEAAPRGCCPC